MKITTVGNVMSPYQKLKAYSHKEQTAYSSSTDKLELSEQAMLFSEALTQAKRTASAAAVDKQERIEEIRAQIADASYSVDAREVAKKMLMV